MYRAFCDCRVQQPQNARYGFLKRETARGRRSPDCGITSSFSLNYSKRGCGNFGHGISVDEIPATLSSRCLGASSSPRRSLAKAGEAGGEAFLLFFFLLLPLASPAQSDGAAVRIDASAYQRVVDENLALRKAQAQSEGEADELRRKNASLLVDVQDLERKKDQLSVLVSQLKTPVETQSELARLQSEKLVLVREIERLRRALVATVPPPTNMAPAAVAPAAGSDLFRKVERENADLRLELAKARETTLNETVAKELLSKSESGQRALALQLTAQCQKVAADLEVARRRESALKKALEVQAKKAFAAEARGQKAEVRGQRPEDRGQKAEVRDPRSEIRDPKSEVRDMRSGGDNVPLLLVAAQRMLAGKRVDDAEKLYMKALKLEPNNAQVCYNLGVLYGDYARDYRKAVKYYRRYIDLAPQAPDVAAVRSWVLDLESKSDW